MGGTETDPGIFINWTLRLGTTASRCISFKKFWPISRDLVFDIRMLELWVVNEVFMTKRNAPKRDFYSTVVMWNRIGKHKAKEDHRRTEQRDCYHGGLNTHTNDNHCSHVEVLETDERHFEPSDTSLAGTNNADDELLIAIKNRLAGVPPMPGALSLKPEAGLRRINQLPAMATKQHYLANTQSDKPKKVPTQVSTQVDDSMIIELKNQSTSTSHVKATSKFTQSGIELASQTEAAIQTQSDSRNHPEGYQLSLPLQNTQSYQPPSSILQSNEQYQRPLQPRRNSFPNHTKQSSPSSAPHANYVDPRPADVMGNSVQSDRNSLSLPGVPDYYEASSQRPSASRSIRNSADEASYNQQIHELSWPVRRNMGAMLPYQQQLVRTAQDRSDLHDDKQSSQSRGILREGSREVNRERYQNVNNPYQNRPSPIRSVREADPYREPSQHQYRPSPSRSIKESDPYREPSQHQYGQLPSRSIKESDPYREPSQHQYAPSPRRSVKESDPYREPSQHQYAPSPSRSVKESDPYQEPSQHQYGQPPSRSVKESDPYREPSQHQYGQSPNRSVRETDYQGPSQPQYRSSPPNRSLREGDPYRESNPYQDRDPPREGPYKEQSPHRVRLEPDWADSRMSPPTQPPPGGQTVLAMANLETGQLCKCGSKELNLVCSCKKPVVQEVVEVTKIDNCFRECRCPRKYSGDEEEPKNKKKKKEKKGKADKEAKAEEKRRKKEEKEREKREKKERKAREKERRKSKSKGKKKSKNNSNAGCIMCSCCKCDGDDGENTNIQSETSYSEDTTKKKSKKEKKTKEKKRKDKKKKSRESNDPPFRSCECPAPIRTEQILQTQQTQVQQQTGIEPSTLGYCNHPDMPCPAIGNAETGQIIVQSRKSIMAETGQIRVQSRKSIMAQPSSENYCRDAACSNAKRRENKQRESSCDGPNIPRSCCCSMNSGEYTVNVCTYPAMVGQKSNAVYLGSTSVRGNSPSRRVKTSRTPSRALSENSGAIRFRDITAAPALIYPNEVGNGDTAHLGRSPYTDPPSTSLPSGFSTNENLINDWANIGRESSTNKRYVPPCVLYLDCTKVKDLCVIIKDKYQEDPS